MQHNTLFRQPRLVLGMAFVLVSVLAAGCAPVIAAAMPVAGADATGTRQERPEPAKRQPLREFEVAEDPTRFVFDTAIVDANGMPAHGSTFITQGYIYPAGTLNGSNGVLADGSPEFPDKVLGEWTCRGWVVGDGMATGQGVSAVTTQLFHFGGDLQGWTLVSDGYETLEIGVPMTRAITGGVGPYGDRKGELVQTLLGITDQMGVSFHFAIETR